MTRKLMITIHLTLAAFLSPILIIVALSGGMYLLGEKGEMASETVYHGEIKDFSFKDQDREQQVDRFLEKNNIEQSYDYIKGGSRFMVTRPTSKTHLVFELDKEKLKVTRRSPNFIASIMEIHKGHGSRAIKLFQKFMALGLLLILATGLYLGLTSTSLRSKTLIISGAGLSTFLLLALF